MSTITCEMCGCHDFVKADNLFCCQNCGIKYTLEEARKLIKNGEEYETEPLSQQQQTQPYPYRNELENLFKAARNARKTGNNQTAVMHYERISAIDPDNWESLFYLVILRTTNIKNSQIQSSAIRIYNCIPTIFKIINTKLNNDNEKKAAINEVILQCYTTATLLTNASHSFYKSLTKGDGLIALTGVYGATLTTCSVINALDEDAKRCFSIANIMVACGNNIEAIFNMNDADYRGFALYCWNNALGLHSNYSAVHTTQTLFNEDFLRTLNGKINTYMPNGYHISQQNSSLGFATVTVKFDSKITAVGIGEIYFSINNGEKQTLKRKKEKTFTLQTGYNTLKILNSMCKQEYTFVVNGPKTINIYSISFNLEITET